MIWKNETLSLVNKDKKIEIFKNPTWSQEREIRKRFVEDYWNQWVWEYIRTTYDSKGNSYSWYSNDWIHQQIEKILKDKWIDVNQIQWEKAFNKIIKNK